jgi:hypothetical protein
MLNLIFKIIFGKEGKMMMAMLWSQKIILGKKSFADVPAKLKEQVAEILVESGLEDLISEKGES